MHSTKNRISRRNQDVSITFPKFIGIHRFLVPHLSHPHTNRSTSTPVLCLNVIILFLARNRTRLTTTTIPECLTEPKSQTIEIVCIVFYCNAWTQQTRKYRFGKKRFILFKKENTMRKTPVAIVQCVRCTDGDMVHLLILLLLVAFCDGGNFIFGFGCRDRSSYRAIIIEFWFLWQFLNHFL